MDAEDLFAGPRGRRLMLNSALAYAAQKTETSLGTALTGFYLRADVVSVADEIRRLTLSAVTRELARALLADTAAQSMYWEEPDDLDRLAVRPEVMTALRPFAESLCGSDATDWWDTSVDQTSQWEVQWEHEAHQPSAHSSHEILRQWHRTTVAAEAWAAKNLPADHHYPYSGTWWSAPPAELVQTTRQLWDNTCAGMWFVEDCCGEERVRTRRAEISAQRIFEIGSPEDWIYLCRMYPLEVTAQKRHDWYRSTGRAGEWTMPDWAEVAADYDGVHLTVAGYLRAAGRALPTGPNTASVLAGWNPDTTYWFTGYGQPRSDWNEWIVERQADTFSWICVKK